jgi:hypothetical protein
VYERLTLSVEVGLFIIHFPSIVFNPLNPPQHKTAGQNLAELLSYERGSWPGKGERWGIHCQKVTKSLDHGFSQDFSILGLDPGFLSYCSGFPTLDDSG